MAGSRGKGYGHTAKGRRRRKGFERREARFLPVEEKPTVERNPRPGMRSSEVSRSRVKADFFDFFQLCLFFVAVYYLDLAFCHFGLCCCISQPPVFALERFSPRSSSSFPLFSLIFAPSSFPLLFFCRERVWTEHKNRTGETPEKRTLSALTALGREWDASKWKSPFSPLATSNNFPFPLCTVRHDDSTFIH